MDYRYKPMYLPQINAPFSILFNELKSRDIGYKLVNKPIGEIEPTQGIVFSDKINSIPSDNIKAIFLSNDNKIVDGHHRYGSAMSNGSENIKSFFIDLPFLECIRVLNQIQDLYDYEIKTKEKQHMENENDFLNFIENVDVKQKGLGGSTKLVGYRRNEINDNSKIGNFFMLNEIEGYVKYEIEFDNLLDTDEIGNIIFHSNESPVFGLAKIWFPNIDFDKISDEYDIEKNMLINRCVSEKASKLGYDGIKYGDILLHGLK